MSIQSPDQDGPQELLAVNNQLAKDIEQLVLEYASPPYPVEPASEGVKQAVRDTLLTEHGIEVTREDVGQSEKLLAYAGRQRRQVTFQNISDPDMHITLELGFEPIVRRQESLYFSDAPEHLRFPAVAFSLWNNNRHVKSSSPYGELTHAIDVNGKLYSFSNVFLLNQFDQGFKYEDVVKIADKDKVASELQDYSLKPKDIPHFNVPISSERSRIVPIAAHDYRMMQGRTMELKAGAFRKIH